MSRTCSRHSVSSSAARTVDTPAITRKDAHVVKSGDMFSSARHSFVEKHFPKLEHVMLVYLLELQFDRFGVVCGDSVTHLITQAESFFLGSAL